MKTHNKSHFSWQEKKPFKPVKFIPRKLEKREHAKTKTTQPQTRLPQSKKAPVMKKHETSETFSADQPEAKPQSDAPQTLAGVPSVAVVSFPRMSTGKTTVTAPTGTVFRVDLGGMGGTINLYIQTTDPTVTSTVNIMVVDVNSPAATALPATPFANFLGSVSDQENSFLFVYSDSLSAKLAT